MTVTNARALVVKLDEADRREVVSQAHALSGLTRRDFAELMGVDRGTLGDWLNGNYVPSRQGTLAAVGAAVIMGVGVIVEKPWQYVGRRK
jgi:DNA-binding XRE family transcriptional regulator